MSFIKTFIIIVFLSTTFTSIQAQIGLTVYSFQGFGVQTSQSNPISGELKVFANRPFEILLLELNGFYNFKPKEYHQFSLGLGINTTPFLSAEAGTIAVLVPLQLTVFPLQDFKRLSLVFELAPVVSLDTIEWSHLRAFWGFRYYFSVDE